MSAKHPMFHLVLVGVLILVFFGIFFASLQFASEQLFTAAIVVGWCAAAGSVFFVFRLRQEESKLTLVGACVVAVAIVMSTGMVFSICSLIFEGRVKSQLYNRMQKIGQAMHAYADKQQGRLPTQRFSARMANCC